MDDNTAWKPGDPLFPDVKVHHSCGPCLERWTAEVTVCPSCGQPSTETLLDQLEAQREELKAQREELEDLRLEQVQLCAEASRRSAVMSAQHAELLQLRAAVARVREVAPTEVLAVLGDPGRDNVGISEGPT